MCDGGQTEVASQVELEVEQQEMAIVSMQQRLQSGATCAALRGQSWIVAECNSSPVTISSVADSTGHCSPSGGSPLLSAHVAGMRHPAAAVDGLESEGMQRDEAASGDEDNAPQSFLTLLQSNPYFISIGAAISEELPLQEDTRIGVTDLLRVSWQPFVHHLLLLPQGSFGAQQGSLASPQVFT